MLNPIHLRTLRTVVLTSSFAAAADELGYTASAVSQQMAGLERATGLVLFERQPRGVVPTAAAHVLATRAQHALGELAAVERQAREIAGARRGRVVIGSFPTANARIVPRALARIATGEPEVEMSLDEGEPWNLIPRVMDGSVDVAISYTYDLVPGQLPDGLATVPLLTEPLFALRSLDHRTGRKPEIALGELRDEPWAATRAGTPGAHFLDRVSALAGFEPRVTYRSNDYAVIRGLVATGLGVAVVPALAIDATAHVAVSTVTDLATSARHVVAVYRPSAYQPLRDLVIGSLVEAAAAALTSDVARPLATAAAP